MNAEENLTSLAALALALPPRFAHLANFETIRFIREDGTEDAGVSPDAVLAICRAVIEAFECGEFDRSLHAVVPRAREMQKAISGFDWSSLRAVQ